MEKIIHLNEANMIIKRYKVRQTGNRGVTIETTVPREVFEREARRKGMTLKEAVTNLVAVWRFDGFEGLLLTFEKSLSKE